MPVDIQSDKLSTNKREHVKKTLAALVLVASISMGGCVPSEMNVAISDNGEETNVLMKHKDAADISINKDVLFVVFDGFLSTAMQRYAEKLKDKYVLDGYEATCIRHGDNPDKTREAAIEANAKGWVICLMSYSNSGSVMGAGGRNAFAAWTEQQGFPIVEFRGDDTWGNYSNHVESNVTGILNIRGHSLGHRGPKITKADLENPDTLYWDIHAPVPHTAMFGDKDYWFVHQLVCVINGDDPFDPVDPVDPADSFDSFDSFDSASDDPPKDPQEPETPETIEPTKRADSDTSKGPITVSTGGRWPEEPYYHPSEEIWRRGYLKWKQRAREKAKLKKTKPTGETKDPKPTSRPAAVETKPI
jgi:hypothetical protein